MAKTIILPNGNLIAIIGISEEEMLRRLVEQELGSDCLVILDKIIKERNNLRRPYYEEVHDVSGW